MTSALSPPSNLVAANRRRSRFVALLFGLLLGVPGAGIVALGSTEPQRFIGWVLCALAGMFPLALAVGRLGNSRQVEAMLAEAEVELSHHEAEPRTMAGVTVWITRSFVVLQYSAQVVPLRRDDVLWVYTRVSTSHIAGSPEELGRSETLEIVGRRRRTSLVLGGPSRDHAMRTFSEACPGVFVGYDQALTKLAPAELAERVRARRG